VQIAVQAMSCRIFDGAICRPMHTTMRRTSVLAVALITVTALAKLSSACGGSINTNYGYLDDAGAYHASDGATLFTPGSACVGFDASLIPAACTNPDIDNLGNPDCVDWSATLSPHGYPLSATSCLIDNASLPDSGAHCSPAGLLDLQRTQFQQCPGSDPGGTTFCTAWAQQFVVSGTAWAPCQRIIPADGGAILACYGYGQCPDGITTCSYNYLCVTDDGARYECKRPCEL
jgi:hypothetical protein